MARIRELDTRSNAEKLRAALRMMGYDVFTLCGWFGKDGFIATPRYAHFGSNILIGKRLKSGTYQLQLLNGHSGIDQPTLVRIRECADGATFVEGDNAFNITRRGLVYDWRYLARIDELRVPERLAGGQSVSATDRKALWRRVATDKERMDDRLSRTYWSPQRRAESAAIQRTFLPRRQRKAA